MTDFDAKARGIARDPHLDAVVSIVRDELGGGVIAAALKEAYALGYDDGRANLPRYTPIEPT